MNLPIIDILPDNQDTSSIIINIDNNFKLKSYNENNNLNLFLQKTNLNPYLFLGIMNIKHDNFINFDFNFCRKANNLKLNNSDLIDYIFNIGLNDGIFFHPKQLINYNNNIELLEDNNKEIYVNDNKNYYRLNDYCNSIYNRDVNSFLSNFTIINIPKDYYNKSILILLFWGDNEIGHKILKKLENINFQFNLLIIKKKGLDYKFSSNYFIIETNEYGNDIIPGIIGFNFINQLLIFDYILKLQTKSNDVWRNENIDYFLYKNEQEFIDLLENKEFVCNPKYERNICFKMISKESFEGFYQEGDTFPAGSIFFVKKSKFENIIKFIKKYGYLKYFLQNLYDNHSVLRKKSPIHFLERLFGVKFEIEYEDVELKNNIILKKVMFYKTNISPPKKQFTNFKSTNYVKTPKNIKDLFFKRLQEELNLNKNNNLNSLKIKEIKNKVYNEIYFNNQKQINLHNNETKENKDIIENNKRLTLIKRTKKYIISNKSNSKIKETDELKESNRNKIIDYYKTTTHCYGWKNIMETLKSKFNTELLIIDNIENYFLVDKMLSLNKPWFGFIHQPLNIPKLLKKNYLQIETLLNNSNFIESLDYCKGIISFSYNISKELSLELKNTNIYYFYHPISIPQNISNNFLNENTIEIDRIIDNNSIIFLGQHLRRNYLMFRFPNYKIKWLYGLNKKYLESKKNLVNYECRIYNTKYNWNNIDIDYYDNENDYFTQLINNIIIISTYVSNANNSILDVISLKIPALIERKVEIEDYIGKDYPGFFNLNELKYILNNKDKLKEILYESLKYLEDNYELLTEKLSLNRFVNSIKSVLTEKKYVHLFIKNGNIIKLNDIENKLLFDNFISNKKLIIEYDGNLDDINFEEYNEIEDNLLLFNKDKIVGEIKIKNNNFYVNTLK